MQQASVSILKAQLSQYLAAVKAGEEVIVTERGRPIARIAPIEEGDDPDGRIAVLIREGRLKPPTAASSARPAGKLPRDPAGRTLEALLAERAEGR
jgi:prevent-host-death family protein